MSDLRFAIRALRATPIVSIVTVLTLALGIGANSAIFTVVNSLLLRALPVAEPQHLATITSATALNHGFKAGPGWSYAMWDALARRPGAIDSAFTWRLQRIDLSQRGEAQPVNGLFASGDFFRTVGVSALIGRTFGTTDDVRGGGPDGPVVVISYAFWQRRFGGAAGVIGTPLVIKGAPFTIVGVTPPEFFGIEVGQSFDVAIPVATEPLISGRRAVIDSENALLFTVMVRLKPEQSLDAATAALRTIQPAILATLRNPPSYLSEPFVLEPAATGTSDVSRLRQQYEQPLLMIGIIVGLVLLVACVNLANLFVARAAARRHELSVRLALGAPRLRLARQLLLESLLLGGLGAALGVLFASWASRALVAQLSTADRPIFLDLSPDWRVLAFTVTAAGLTVLFFGTAPAFAAARVQPAEALKDAGAGRGASGRGGNASAGGRRLANSLVVTQVAASLVLVAAAGLLVRSFERLASVPLGFDRDRVLLFSVDTGRVRIDPADRNQFHHRLVAAASAAPGVAHAAGSIWTPAGGGGGNLMLDARGRSPNPERQVVANFVTPGWFATYGIPLRAGRDIGERDVATTQPVVVVNDAFVRRFLPDRHAIGVTLGEGISGFVDNRTVVGVVGDVVYGSRRDAISPTVYLPLAQGGRLMPPGPSIRLSVRPAAGSPLAAAPAVAAALTTVDRDLGFSVRTLADQANASLIQERLLAVLSGFFGSLALLLAGLGLYGVTSHAVTSRRTEIGIRMALGARRTDVVRLVLRQTLTTMALGVVVGVAAAAAGTRYLNALLFGVTPLDAATFAGVILLFLIVALAAALTPARRAASIDPLAALRSE